MLHNETRKDRDNEQEKRITTCRGGGGEEKQRLK